jgi:hypothetical protein
MGETGKALRGDLESQVVAFYLVTSPHASMSGVYWCPIPYLAQDTGIPLEGACKALRRLIEMGFCEYDEVADVVFVVRMAHFQVGPSLAPKDNRKVGLLKELSKLPKTSMLQRFFDVYYEAFSFTSYDVAALKVSPSEAPRKPLGSPDQDQDQDQDHDQEQEGEVSRREARASTGPLSLGFAEPDTKPDQVAGRQVPSNASPKLLAIVDAMKRAEFVVPGKGTETIWKNARRPAILAAKLEEACPSVDVPALIVKLAGWTVANPQRAKRDLARFLWNAATKDQDKPRIGGVSEETYRHGTDLADEVRGTRRGGGR